MSSASISSEQALVQVPSIAFFKWDNRRFFGTTLRQLEPYIRHPQATCLQNWLASVLCQLREVGCQTQTCKLTLSL
jgi:hypothetical protein